MSRPPIRPPSAGGSGAGGGNRSNVNPHPFRPSSALRMGIVGSAVGASGTTSRPSTGSGDGSSFRLSGQLGGTSGGGRFVDHAPATIAFVLETKARPAMRLWVKEATEWIKTIVGSGSNAGVASTGENEAFNDEDEKAATKDSTSPPTSATTTTLSHQHHQQQGDLLDSHALNLVARLLPNLAHHSSGVRAGVMHLILQLGEVFGNRPRGVSGMNRSNEESKESKENSSSATTTTQSVEEQKAIEREQRNQAIIQCVLREQDTFTALNVFFTLMGPTLTPMVLALVDRLEANYLHPHTHVRDTSIVISANLMVLHPPLFISRDKLVAVWNLFFLLDLLSGNPSTHSHYQHHAFASQASGGPGGSLSRFNGYSSAPTLTLTNLVQSLPLSGTRLSIIESLGLLVSLFVPHHISLTMQIVSRLLRLPEKSALESRAIQKTMLAIGNLALDCARREEEPTTSGMNAGQTTTTTTSPLISYSLYPIFLSCLSAHQEENLDVLAWCIFAYTTNLQIVTWNENRARSHAPMNMGRKGVAEAQTILKQAKRVLTKVEEVEELWRGGAVKSTGDDSNEDAATPLTTPFSTRYPVDLLHTPHHHITLPHELAEFLPALENHLRASPPLIRFGAALSLAAVLRVYPSILAWNDALYPHLLWGVQDSEHIATQECYIEMLKQVSKGLGDDTLQTMIETWQCQVERDGVEATTTPATRATSSAATSTALIIPTLDSILSRAISLAPSIPSRFLGFILSNLSFQPHGQQVRLLQLVVECAKQLKQDEKECDVFAQKLLPLLNGSTRSTNGIDDYGLPDYGQPSSIVSSISSEIPLLVVRIFHAFPAGVVSTLSDQFLIGLATYFQQTLDLAPVGGSGGEDGSSSNADGPAITSTSVAPTTASSTFDTHLLASRVIQVLESIHLFPWSRLNSRDTGAGVVNTSGVTTGSGTGRLDTLLQSCVSNLVLHPAPNVRLAVYTMLASCSKLFLSTTTFNTASKLPSTPVIPSSTSPSKSLLSKACSLALIGLGDVIPANVTAAAHALQLLVAGMNLTFGAPGEKDGEKDVLLEQLRRWKRELASEQLLQRLQGYDQLARAFMQYSGEQIQISLFSIRDCIMGSDFKEFVIKLYSEISIQSSSSSLPIHGHWWSLLCSHCGQLIRHRVPVMLLIPLLNNDDRALRAATCHAIKRACVLSGNVNERLVQDIVNTLPQLLSGRPFEIESAYYLLHILIPLKLKNFNAFLIEKYFSDACETLVQPSLTFFIRRTLLLFIEALIMVHPRLCFKYLEQLRNNIREMLCHINLGASGVSGSSASGGTSGSSGAGGASSNQLHLISRVYSLVCFTASSYGTTNTQPASALGESTAASYVRYLKQDLQVLNQQDSGGADVAGNTITVTRDSYDPLLSKLTSGQLKLVTLVTLHALGCIEARGETVREVVEELIPFLSHPDAQYRFLAVEGLQTQLPMLILHSNANSSSATLAASVAAYAKWCLLPLLADADVTVRIAVSRTGIMQDVVIARTESTLTGAASTSDVSPIKRRLQLLQPEDGDEFEDVHTTDEDGTSTPLPKKKPTASPTFVLAPSTPLDIGVGQHLARADTEDPFYAYSDLELASDVRLYPAPVIGPVFFGVIQTCVKRQLSLMPFPQEEKFDELMYHMQQTFKIPGGVNAATALTLAEISNFVANRPEQARPIMKLLLLQLDCSLNSLTRPLIFGCVLAIQRICVHRNSRQWAPTGMVFDYCSELGVLREGDLVALKSLTAEPKLDMREVVTTEQVNGVTEKLVATLHNPRVSLMSKQMALEILASLCLKVEVDNVSAIIDYIFGMLEKSADADFHEVCGEQLSRLFSSLPLDHPLLETFTLALALDVRSHRLENRLRALTTLVILQKRLGEERRKEYFLRLLADPNREVKHHTLAVLLNPQHSHGFDHLLLPVVKLLLSEKTQEDTKRAVLTRKASVATGSAASTTSSSATSVSGITLDDLSDQQLLRMLDDVTDAYHRHGQQELVTNAPSGVNASKLRRFSQGPFNAGALITQGPPVGLQAQQLSDGSKPLLEIPLKDLDPFNLRWLQSPWFLNLIRLFGMDRPMIDVTALQSKQKDAYTAFQQLTSDVNASTNSGFSSSSTTSAANSISADILDSEDSPTLLDRLSPAKRNDLLADIRAKQLAAQTSDFSPLLAVLLKQDQGKQANTLVQELLSMLEHLGPEVVAADVSTTVKKDGKKLKKATQSPSKDLTPVEPTLNLDEKLHTLGVVMNLLQAFNYSISQPTPSNAATDLRDSLSTKLQTSLLSLQSSSGKFKTYGESLRTKTLNALSQLHAYRGPQSGTKWHVSMRNEAAFQRREHYMKTMMSQPGVNMMGAEGGAGKEGKQEESKQPPSSPSPTGEDIPVPQTKQDILELVRSYERNITRWGNELSHTTLLQTKLIQCVSQLLLTSSTHFSSANLISSYTWLGLMFVDMHRGIREVVREGMVGLCETRCTMGTGGAITPAPSSDSSTAETFLQHVQQSIYSLFKSLRDPATRLTSSDTPISTTVSPSTTAATTSPDWLTRRRPRADLIYLLGHLILYSTNSKMRTDVIDLFISCWDDPDSQIRSQAIDMIQYLSRINYPEILSYIKSKDANKTSPIMKAILQRVRDPDYGDHAKLNQLLQWYYVQ